MIAHRCKSRKKVAALTQAAKKHDVYALLRSGGSPGIMYVEGGEAGVSSWVGDVKVSVARLHSQDVGGIQLIDCGHQRLRYLDHKLLRRPAEMIHEHDPDKGRNELVTTGLHELDTVKDFGAKMERRGVLRWWRKAMEFDTPDDRL